MGRLTVESPLGPLTLTSADGALVALDWGGQGEDASDAVLALAAQQLDDYFAGRIRDFDLPLAPRGTAFRQKVWAAMQAIPYGRVATYVGGGGAPGGYSGFGGLETKDWLLRHERLHLVTADTAGATLALHGT